VTNHEVAVNYDLLEELLMVSKVTKDQLFTIISASRGPCNNYTDGFLEIDYNLIEMFLTCQVFNKWKKSDLAKHELCLNFDGAWDCFTEFLISQAANPRFSRERDFRNF